jgi:hypothetical protein
MIAIIVLLVILVVVIGMCFFADKEKFYIGRNYIRNAAPYYTTTFQAFPGKFMTYDSTRERYCLQQHQEYPGYRNCMLFFQ